MKPYPATTIPSPKKRLRNNALLPNATLEQCTSFGLSQAAIDREYVVPILIKAIAVLELLAVSSSPLPVHSICLRTGIARSTVYRIVRTLFVSGYLHEPAPGRYAASGARKLNVIRRTQVFR